MADPKRTSATLDGTEIDRRITYHPPTPAAKQLHEKIRAAIGEALFKLARDLPECREKSLAATKLEEAMFWANAAIARNHEQLY